VRCGANDWRTLIAGLRGQSRAAKIQAVNAFINRAAYVTDPVNYGLPDYWATPLQFFAQDGDCEDYAIAKFITLTRLGFSDDDMRIVVVDDTNLGVPHAVLVVYLDGQAIVLDNQVPQVIPADLIHHYRPIYSINQSAWWLHRP
jgi:predicted transglutaminase-like cysteine proteinase